MVSLSPVGALGLLARIALAAVLSAAFLNVAIPSAARAQASETPPSQAEPKPEMREACPGWSPATGRAFCRRRSRLPRSTPTRCGSHSSATRPS